MAPRQLVPAVVAVLCLGAVGLQAWTVGQLRADVAALRAEVAGLSGGPAAAACPAAALRTRPPLRPRKRHTSRRERNLALPPPSW